MASLAVALKRAADALDERAMPSAARVRVAGGLAAHLSQPP